MFVQIIISAFIGVIFGFICSNIARKRNKNSMLWFQLGFFFGVLALIALLLLSLKNKSKDPKLAEETVALSNSSSILTEPLHIEDKTSTTLDQRDWYYLDSAHKQAGPISFSKLKEDVKTSAISGTTLLWSEGMENWVPLNKLSYLQMVLKSE
ncbi:MAG: hypothetical protein S4CHLAM7_09140 [Chlamydiae bacterium]|nr:hypothetical protein [Chlamydiota bacterium]